MRPLRQSGNRAERFLLAAGASERPDAERMRDAARGLGLVPRALTIVAAIVIAARAAKWSSLAVWGVAPLVAVVAVGLAARAVERPVSVPVSLREGAPQSAATATAGPAALVDGPPVQPLPSPGAVADSSRTIHDPTPARSPVRPKTTSTPATALRDQAGVLDRVRVLVGAGDAEAALASLNDFDRRYAGGPLSEEALLLRIEALARRGDRSAAAALAKSFLLTHPASVHVDRVTALSRALTP